MSPAPEPAFPAPRPRMPERASWVAAIVAILGAAGVARLQPALAAQMHAVKARDDVYVLPPPKTLAKLTLGYKAQAVDQLWAKLLVENGIHHAEHREFPDLTSYIDAIIEIEPDYAPLYRYVDTLLVFRPRLHPSTTTPAEVEPDARRARAYLQIGLDHRPLDGQLWLEYGQFVAFLAPSFLSDKAEQEEWRKAGSLAVLRAVELGASADRSVSAASVLSRLGQKKAIVAQLRRAYALTDDPDTREDLAARIRAYESQEASESTTQDVAFIERHWKAEAPFLSRGEYLQIGPPVDPLLCAGGELGPLRAAIEAEAAATGPHPCRRDWNGRLPSQADAR